MLWAKGTALGFTTAGSKPYNEPSSLERNEPKKIAIKSVALKFCSIILVAAQVFSESNKLQFN